MSVVLWVVVKPLQKSQVQYRDVADKGLNAVSDIASKVKEAVTPEPTAPVDNTSVKLKAVAKDWKKPTTVNSASFNKTKVVLAKSPETPQFLAEQGLNPYTHIEDGKYNTEESAQALRDTAGKMSSDTLRPSFQMADYTTPKTPVTDLSTPAIANIKSEYGVTAADAKTIQANVKSELSALEEKYPNGMGLTDLHDEKITYAQNAGYSPIKDPSVNNKAIANRAISSALGDMVEAKAPSDIPVGDFNTYLSSYYKAADYLDTLQGKKAPVSTGQAIARGVAKFGGAALARHLIPGGGELVSSFAGYQIGKAVEHALENMTNPMRDSFLKNLKITNPEAFTKVQQYMGKVQAEQATLPRLPTPKQPGTSENPIITPARNLLQEERQTAGEVRKNTSTYNPVDKKYYNKGERGGNSPKGEDAIPNSPTSTIK